MGSQEICINGKLKMLLMGGGCEQAIIGTNLLIRSLYLGQIY